MAVPTEAQWELARVIVSAYRSSQDEGYPLDVHIAYALAAERNAALEEAAACAQRVADGENTHRIGEMVATIIADAIRALRAAPRQA